MSQARTTLLATLAIFGQQPQPIEYFNCVAIVVAVVALQQHKAQGATAVWAWIGRSPGRPFLVVKLLADSLNVSLSVCVCVSVWAGWVLLFSDFDMATNCLLCPPWNALQLESHSLLGLSGTLSSTTLHARLTAQIGAAIESTRCTAPLASEPEPDDEVSTAGNTLFWAS